MGHPYYGKMAYNLALSIRYSDSAIPITVLTAGGGLSTLSQQQKNIFDQIILCEGSVHNDSNWIRAKFYAYELSPYEQTILMDADTIWLAANPIKSATSLIDSIGADFAMSNEGYQDEAVNVTSKKYTCWVDPKQVRENYNGGSRIYQLRSEFMYFTKSQANKTFFDLARSIYDEPRVAVESFAGHYPDEFAFNIASYMLCHYPHRDKWSPIYWRYMHHTTTKAGEAYKDYYAYSIGGNFTQQAQKDIYNAQVKYYHRQMNIMYPHLLDKYGDKRHYLKEREKI